MIPVNDPTLKDKMNVLKAYPEATVKLVESLGGQEQFAAAIKGELPAFLYHLLKEAEIPEELRDTRYGMKAYQNPEIVEAAEESEPYVHLLDALRKKVYPGAKDLKKTVAEIFQDLHDARIPRGIVPANPNTLGKYLTSIYEMVPDEVDKDRNKDGIFYTLNFPDTRKAGE